MGEFKAKIGHSTAMAQIFNAEIAHFPCSIANHGLFSTSQGSLGNSLRYILLSTLSNPA